MSDTIMGIEKKRIVFLYDHFFPGYKAGGPIQSLCNLAAALEHDYDIYVITTGFDLGVSEPYPVLLNSWSMVQLDSTEAPLKVWYTTRDGLGVNMLSKIFIEIQPETIYINGLFTWRFVINPVIAFRKAKIGGKLVICPRGMLQTGNIAIKKIKKTIYLVALRFSGLLQNVEWHATSDEERCDILKWFPYAKRITVVSNLGKKPVVYVDQLVKNRNELRLCYLSLITEKKNLHLLLQALHRVPGNIQLDIYGPVKDLQYWSKCKELMKKMEQRVSYKGVVRPFEVQSILTKYHALVLLSRGENFGHAIYESLSVGRPVITSYFTPWENLSLNSAGWNVDISDSQSIEDTFSLVSQLGQDEFDRYCHGAYVIARQHYSDSAVLLSYLNLFGSVDDDQQRSNNRVESYLPVN